MTRSELEHLIRAAGSIADDREIVVIGSQAVLGQFPDAPTALLASMEADLFPLNHPERADLVDGAIGEGSPFHQLFGYYAQGVSERTATLPDGWRGRLTVVKNANTGGITGLCLEVHDLAISKYVAGRDKDREFTRELARHHLTSAGELGARLAHTVLAAPLGRVVAGRIGHDFPPGRAGRRGKRGEPRGRHVPAAGFRTTYRLTAPPAAARGRREGLRPPLPGSPAA